MELLEVINRKVTAVDIEAQNKEEVFSYACRKLYEDGCITSVEEFKRDLYMRENEGQTGIGEGIAIPHGKSKAVKRNCISIFKLKNPIYWETLDDKPVQVLILFAVSLEDKNEYFLRLMAAVAGKLAQEGVSRKLLECNTREELLAVFA